MRFAGLLTVVLVASAGCGVKPPLRYVAADDTLHEIGFIQQGAAARAQSGDAEIVAAELPAVGAVRRPEDAARAHYATAVGLQATCHYEEALAHLRGYLSAEPNGEYAARAMVRMATIYLEPGHRGRDPERARSLIAEVFARFPDSTAAAVARELELEAGVD